MIRSMTAFAREEKCTDWGTLCWEIRTVNHRYLDISIRLPEEFRSLEPKIYEHLQKQVKRGKVNCSLYFQTNPEASDQFQVNEVMVERLWGALKTVQRLTNVDTEPSPLDILRWQGVLSPKDLDIEEASQAVFSLLQHTVTQLVEHREREGNALAELIAQRCDAIDEEVKKARVDLPAIMQGLQERLHSRLAELTEIDSDRVEQEMALLAQKMDVAEELDRLETHLKEIRDILQQNKPIGRRLDFLVQELHREANTLGAKSNHVNTTYSSVELKVLIEQIREQTQNIE